MVMFFDAFSMCFHLILRQMCAAKDALEAQDACGVLSEEQSEELSEELSQEQSEDSEWQVLELGDSG